MYRLITCPETAHLEMIEVEDTPYGYVIAACSRFRPPDCVECPRTCAARMDRRDMPCVNGVSLLHGGATRLIRPRRA
jgi:hypothetical protein